MRSKRQHRDLHFMDEEGMVACNPRDREAAHRAQMEGIATQNRQAVTCGKCRATMQKMRRDTEDASFRRRGRIPH